MCLAPKLRRFVRAALEFGLITYCIGGSHVVVGIRFDQEGRWEDILHLKRLKQLGCVL